VREIGVVVMVPVVDEIKIEHVEIRRDRTEHAPEKEFLIRNSVFFETRE
jgi:hypothetical protein